MAAGALFATSLGTWLRCLWLQASCCVLGVPSLPREERCTSLDELDTGLCVATVLHT